jgi:hypothetical protein
MEYFGATFHTLSEFFQARHSLPFQQPQAQIETQYLIQPLSEINDEWLMINGCSRWG